MCNCAGAEKSAENVSGIGLGRSSVNAPLLGVCGRSEDARESLLFQTLDTRILRKARDIYRIRYDLADELVDETRRHG